MFFLQSVSLSFYEMKIYFLNFDIFWPQFWCYSTVLKKNDVLWDRRKGKVQRGMKSGHDSALAVVGEWKRMQITGTWKAIVSTRTGLCWNRCSVSRRKERVSFWLLSQSYFLADVPILLALSCELVPKKGSVSSLQL